MKEANKIQKMMLFALNMKMGSRIFMGVEDRDAVKRRRKANKVARRQRRVNRVRGQ